MKILFGLKDNALLQRDENDLGRCRFSAEVNGTLHTTLGTLRQTENGFLLAGLPLGGPHTLTLSDDTDRQTFTLWVGDLWILGGQSNMEGAGRVTPGIGQEPLCESVRCYSLGEYWETAKPVTHEPWLSRDGCIGGCWRREQKNSVWDEELPGIYRGTPVRLRAVGPGYYFAKKMWELTAVPQGVIPCAKGGSNIVQWTKDDANGLYAVMMRRIAECGGFVRGLYWDQGESRTVKKDFLQETLQFFTDLREDLHRPDLPIVQTQVSKSMVGQSCFDPQSGVNWSVTKETQRKMDGLFPNLVTVSAADADYDDLIHYSSAFQQKMGVRAANAMAALTGAGGMLPPTLERITVCKDEDYAPFNYIFELHYQNVRSFTASGVPSGFTVLPRECDPKTVVNPAAGVQRIEFSGNVIRLYTEVRERPEDHVIYYGFGHMTYCNILADTGFSIPAMGPVSIKTEQVLKSGMQFQSNTTYTATGDIVHVWPEDTFFCNNKEVLSPSACMGDSCQVGFLLEGLKNVVLDFGGATVLFHGRIVPFVLIECENVVIKNLKIDYDRPFYTQAKLLAIEEGRMEVQICDGFDYEIRDGYLYARSETWEKNLNRNDCMLWMYDLTRKKENKAVLGLFGEEIFPNENPPIPIRQYRIEERGDRQIITGELHPGWDYNGGNNMLLITHEVRDKNAITLVGGCDITVRNRILRHGAAMGILAMHTRNITADNFSMYSTPERLVPNNADGIHTFNCSGKIEIKNCHMEGLMDDTVNIHNNYMVVERAEGDRVTLAAGAAGLKPALRPFGAGDTVRIFYGRTQERKTDLKILEIAVDEQNKQHRLTVEGDTAGLAAGDLAENLSAQPEIHIHDCEFGVFRGTMRLQSRNKTLVERCTFANQKVSMLFTGDSDYWLESGPVQDFTVRNCSFKNGGARERFEVIVGVTLTEKEPYYHRNITVENCDFEGSPHIATLRYTDRFVFKNNRCDPGSYITAENCGEIFSDIELRN